MSEPTIQQLRVTKLFVASFVGNLINTGVIRASGTKVIFEVSSPVFKAFCEDFADKITEGLVTGNKNIVEKKPPKFELPPTKKRHIVLE